MIGLENLLSIMKTAVTFLPAALAASGAFLVALFTGCAPTYPGGLTEEEFNALPSEKRAELTIAQERADAAQQANIQRSLDRYERQREFEASRKPTIKLSDEETKALNSLTE